MTPDRWSSLYLPVCRHHHHTQAHSHAHVWSKLCMILNIRCSRFIMKSSILLSTPPFIQFFSQKRYVTYSTFSHFFSFTSIIYNLLLLLFLSFYFNWFFYKGICGLSASPHIHTHSVFTYSPSRAFWLAQYSPFLLHRENKLSFLGYFHLFLLGHWLYAASPNIPCFYLACEHPLFGGFPPPVASWEG